MKKLLYSVAALALFATTATAQEINISGSYSWQTGVAFEKDSKANMVGDSEIAVSGNTTLENGIRFDAIVQLEADQVSDATIDESYVKVSYPLLGELRLGSTKQAHFLFKQEAPVVSAISDPLGNDQLDRYIPTEMKLFSHAGSADHMKAVYLTPNILGFQAGASYTPSDQNTDDAPTKMENKNVSIGGNYVGQVQNVGVAVSAGYTDSDETTVVQGGGKVSYAGFSVGGSYAKDDMNMKGWNAGVSYEGNPVKVGLTYAQTDTDIYKLAMYTVAADYSLGSGVSVGSSVFMVDEDIGDEKWGALAGLKVTF